ncbi:MAG: ATP-binding cassette domain-containing protein [Propioniciclava sp.]
MIEIQNISRRFGRHPALSDVGFTIPDGSVTGFVGPNGAGKSTLLRVVAGLDIPLSGTISVDGVVQSPGQPRARVGALLDASWVHPRRRAVDHLSALALVQDVPRHRVHEVLDLTGLTDVARRPMGQYSLGMRQRLGSRLFSWPGPPTCCSTSP